MKKFVKVASFACAFVLCALLVTACGTQSKLIKKFALYADNCTASSNGVIMNRYVDNGNTTNFSGATYFGEEDKNLDWDGTEMTIEYDLDLSVLEEGKYTSWVLAFNKNSGSTETPSYGHVDEIRIGIAKTANGFVAAELNGVWHDAEKDYETIVNGAFEEKAFEGEKANVLITISYEEGTLEYSFDVNDTVITNEKAVEGIVGLRNLWNAAVNVDGVEISNLKLNGNELN